MSAGSTSYSHAAGADMRELDDLITRTRSHMTKLFEAGAPAGEAARLLADLEDESGRRAVADRAFEVRLDRIIDTPGTTEDVSASPSPVAPAASASPKSILS